MVQSAVPFNRTFLFFPFIAFIKHVQYSPSDLQSTKYLHLKHNTI